MPANGLYRNEERLCKKIKCGNAVATKICPIRCGILRAPDRNLLRETTQKQMEIEGGSHEPTVLHDDIMCMRNSDCPKTFPLCIPGQHTMNILSKLDDRVSLFIGRCKSLKCKDDADCFKMSTNTMFAN